MFKNTANLTEVGTPYYGFYVPVDQMKPKQFGTFLDLTSAKPQPSSKNILWFSLCFVCLSFCLCLLKICGDNSHLACSFGAFGHRDILSVGHSKIVKSPGYHLSLNLCHRHRSEFYSKLFDPRHFSSFSGVSFSILLTLRY